MLSRSAASVGMIPVSGTHHRTTEESDELHFQLHADEGGTAFHDVGDHGGDLGQRERVRQRSGRLERDRRRGVGASSHSPSR